MSGIYPAWLGNIGTGDCPELPPPEIVYIEVPGDGGCFTRQIVVKASIILNDKYTKRKKIKLKVKLI